MWRYSVVVALLIGSLSGATKVQKSSPILTNARSQGASIQQIVKAINPHLATPQPEETLRFDDPNTVASDAIGLTNGGTYQAAARFTPDELGLYDGNTLISVAFYHWEPGTHSGRIVVYGPGAPNMPGDTLSTEPYTVTGTGWYRVDLTVPVVIDGANDMWVAVEITHQAGEYPIAVDAGPPVIGKGDWVWFAGGGWAELNDYGLPYNWDILAIVQTGPPPDHDVAATNISAPVGIYFVGDVVDPTATFRNIGANAETFWAYFAIYDQTLDAEVYRESTQLSLNPGDVQDVIFPSYTFGAEGTYTSWAWTVLAGDQNPNNDSTSATCDVYAGQLDYLIIDVDPTPLSGPFIDNVLSGAGLVGTYSTSIGDLNTLGIYKSLWFIAGIFPNNTQIDPNSGSLIEAFLQAGGTAYFEGSDLWGWDPGTGAWNILPWTGIVYAEDGSADLALFQGLDNTLIPDINSTQNFLYTGENNWIDRLTPGPTMGGTAEAVWYNPSIGYNCGVAYDQGTFKTFGQSFEMGGVSPLMGIQSPPADSIVLYIAQFFGLLTDVEETGIQPGLRLFLADAYPNPATRQTTIEFGLPQAMDVNLSVYDASGRLVTTLVNGQLNAGIHRVTWNTNGKVTAGVYFYKLQANQRTLTKKLLIVQ